MYDAAQRHLHNRQGFLLLEEKEVLKVHWYVSDVLRSSLLICIPYLSQLINNNHNLQASRPTFMCLTTASPPTLPKNMTWRRPLYNLPQTVDTGFEANLILLQLKACQPPVSIF